MQSFSQLAQDLHVLDYFQFEKERFFLDIGANDGISLSNSYLLEKDFNWSGICSEPLPPAYEKLIKCRTAICDNNAVFREGGLSLDFSESNLLSGITSHIDCHHNAKEGNIIKVNTITLQDLLENNNAPKIIDYFSLDTEGTELEILKSVDFSKYKFLYINLEHNYIQPRRSEIKELLLNNGYFYKGENKWDDDYIHESMILGDFYHAEDYTKPITIRKIGLDKLEVSSPYWPSDTGIIKNGFVVWNNLGKGKLHASFIDYGNRNMWHRDTRKD